MPQTVNGKLPLCFDRIARYRLGSYRKKLITFFQTELFLLIFEYFFLV